MTPDSAPRHPRAAKQNSTNRGTYSAGSTLPSPKAGTSVSLKTVLMASLTRHDLSGRGADTDFYDIRKLPPLLHRELSRPRARQTNHQQRARRAKKKQLTAILALRPTTKGGLHLVVVPTQSSKGLSRISQTTSGSNKQTRQNETARLHSQQRVRRPMKAQNRKQKVDRQGSLPKRSPPNPRLFKMAQSQKARKLRSSNRSRSAITAGANMVRRRFLTTPTISGQGRTVPLPS